jgi:hypothetical protein
MLTNTYAFAPAGVLGSGSADARPHACTAVRPALLGVVARVQGTAVPAALPAAALPATALPATAWKAVGMQLVAVAPRVRPAAIDAFVRPQTDPITQNDGTTPLGIHPRGRSTS